MNLGAWFNDTISVAAFTGRAVSGTPTFGASASRRARVQPKQTLIRKPNGQEVLSDHQVYVPDEIKILDRVYLPGESNPRVPLAVSTFKDKAGIVVYYRVDL